MYINRKVYRKRNVMIYIKEMKARSFLPLTKHVLQRNSDLPWVANHRVGDKMDAGISMDAALRRYIQTHIDPLYQYDHVMTIVGYVYF